MRARLERYLAARATAGVLLAGEAPGYRGARVSGIPFTSERQLTGAGPAEATASIVHRVLAALGLEDDVLLWNVVPTHPGGESWNRRPTSAEVAAGLPFLRELARGRRVVCVGRVAQAALGGRYVRHPSHGGAAEFRRGLEAALSSVTPEAIRPARLEASSRAGARDRAPHPHPGWGRTLRPLLPMLPPPGRRPRPESAPTSQLLLHTRPGETGP